MASYKIKLGPRMRGSLDSLKPRVLKKRDRRRAGDIHRVLQRRRGSHKWAIWTARAQRKIDEESAAVASGQR